MKTLSIRLLTVVAALAAAAAAADPRFVYETPGEFLSSGDFTGNGVTDVLVLDKATGNARVGLNDGQGNLNWPAPQMSGVESASGCAVGQFLVSGQDGAAVTSSNFNRVNIIGLAGASPAPAPTVITPPGIGPHSLAALSAPLGASSLFDFLLVASSLNNSPAERLDLLQMDRGNATPIAQYNEAGLFDWPEALTLSAGGQTFAAGLVRGETNDALHLWSFESPAAVTCSNMIASGSACTFGVFGRETTPRFVFYVPGQSNIVSMPLQNASTLAVSLAVQVALTEPVQLIVFLDNATNGWALIETSNTVQTLTFQNDAPVLGPIYDSGLAAGNSFTGIASLGGGQFALLDAPAGALASAHAQVIRFDGSAFHKLSDSALPGVTSHTGRANVWLYQQEPFVSLSPGFVSSTNAADWTDSVTLSGGNVSVQAATDRGATSGLGSDSGYGVGAIPTGAATAVVNQYTNVISLFSYGASRPPEPVTVLISPPPGVYPPPLSVSFSTLNPTDKVYYRPSPASAWSLFNAPFTLTNDATVQFYGVTAAGSSRSIIQSAAYSLGGAATTPPLPPGANPSNGNSSGAGSNVTQLSPDGIVWYGRRNPSTDTGSIWAINFDGTDDTFVTTGARPRASSSGRLLAFLRDHDPFQNQGDIWIRELATGNEWLLFTNTNSVVCYNWTPDNLHLVADYGCQIIELDLEEHEINLLQGNCFDEPAVSLLDGSIAFEDRNSSFSADAAISVLDTNGALLLASNAIAGACWPGWSPTGQQMVVADSHDGSVDGGKNLYLTESDGSLAIAVTVFTNGVDGFPHGAVWTPWGDGLVGAGSIGASNGLWFIPLDQDGSTCDCAPRRLATTPGDPIDFAGSVIAWPAQTDVATNTSTVASAPVPTVVTLTPIDITATSVALGDSLFGSGVVLWFTLGTNTNYTSTNFIGLVSNGSNYNDITGLLPGQTYHVRAVASNDVGLVFGGDLTFTTLPVNPTASSLTVYHLPGQPMQFALSSFVTDPYYPLQLVIGPSAQGATVTADATNLYYTPINAIGDAFSYAANDGHGGQAGGVITVSNLPSVGGLPLGVTLAANAVLLNFAVVPGGQYGVQRSTNLLSWTTITVVPITASDIGTLSYVDTPSNSAAFYRLVSSAASFSIPSAPLAMTTNASDTFATNATFNGLVLANGADTTNWFEFNSVFAPVGSFYTVGAQTILGTDTNEEPVSATVTGLLPATPYSYQLVSSNALGVGYGGFVAFETSPLPQVQPAPSPAPTALARPRVSGR